MSKNLFESLFDCRQRADLSPEENFLTESFSYVLNQNELLLRKMINLIYGENIEIENPTIETRKAYVLENTTLFPDMTITFTVDGEQKTILCENKWNSPVNIKQLENYTRLMLNCDFVNLVFICSENEQKFEAMEYCDKALLWEEIYTLIQELHSELPQIREFLEFMKNHDLAPAEPLSPSMIHSYMFSSALPERCMVLTNLLSQKLMPFLPERLRAYPNVSNLRWGRIGIDWGEGHKDYKCWNPYNLFTGFLLDGSDHRISTLKEDSIDLMIAIDLSKKDEIKYNENKLLELKTSVLLKLNYRDFNSVLSINQLKNKSRLLIVRMALTDVIKGYLTIEDQLSKICEFFQTGLKDIYSNPDQEDTILKKIFI